MKIFISGTSFEPSYGGPAWSVSSLAHHLAELGVSVGLWAPDGSAVSSPVIERHDRLRQYSGPLREALSDFGRPDLFHDNGVWLPHNHAIARLARRMCVPRVVSLRGMLEPWSLEHRRWKKRAAWYVYQRRDLQAADTLHATADSEAKNARMLGLTSPIAVVSNGVDLVSKNELMRYPGLPAMRQRTLDGARLARRALFLSRIHPKKGIAMLLEAWATLRPNGWELVLAGPAERGHDEEMLRRVSELGLSGAVKFHGPVYGSDKSALYCSADLFVLPTHSENFGIVVAEALAHEVPVLTTTGAPWRLLETKRCGWWVEPTEAGILEGLRSALTVSDDERRSMGRRGRQIVEALFAWERIAADMHERIYAPLLAGRTA